MKTYRSIQTPITVFTLLVFFFSGIPVGFSDPVATENITDPNNPTLAINESTTSVDQPVIPQKAANSLPSTGDFMMNNESSFLDVSQPPQADAEVVAANVVTNPVGPMSINSPRTTSPSTSFSAAEQLRALASSSSADAWEAALVLGVGPTVPVERQGPGNLWTEYTYPNGVQVSVFPDGRTSIWFRTPNGSIISGEYQNGQMNYIMITLPDGSFQTFTLDDFSDPLPIPQSDGSIIT